MKAKKILSTVLAALMLVGTAITPIAAAENGTAYTDDKGSWFYEPLESGVHSNGGYVLEKVSHPTAGPDDLDSILDPQERGQSYSWSMAEGGDYIYIGTCYNSTFYIYHNAVKNALIAAGVSSADADAAARDIVETVFGVDSFDETDYLQWDPVIMSVNKYTYETEVIFRESALRADMAKNPEAHADYIGQFVKYPGMGYFNVLSGYRMAVEFNGKLYFAGMGNPTATLVEVDPETNTAKIAYAEKVANMTPPEGHEKEKMSNGVHGLVEYEGQLLMCLASADYDRDGVYSPGGIIVASSDPTQGLANWKVIADQADFDFLPGVLQTDGLNGGGIWDIIEYNGYLYVTVVTDTTDLDTGIIHKQGFAMYRGEKEADGDFTWTQVIGGNEEAKMPFGLGIDHSMSCNLWTYVAEDGEEYLYLGTYNDPMLDLNAAFAQSNYELLYNDLDHSIYLYRMNAKEKFEMIGGKDDNPMFPEGPIGNLGAGLGNNSNQYVWRYGEHQDELMIGTYDTATLTYIFTQVTDGQIETVTIDELEARSNAAIHAILTILGQAEDSPWREILDKYVFNNQLHKLYTAISKALSAITKDQNPVPSYREALAKFDELRALVDELDGWYDSLSIWQRRMIEGIIGKDLATWTEEIKAQILEQIDKLQAEFEKLGSIVYYFGVNYYAQQAERGFDLLISNDGENFDAITRDGFGSKNNHGLRTIESTDVGVFFGTANPFQGTQLWLMHSGRDTVKSYVVLDANDGAYADATTAKQLLGEVGTSVETAANYAEPTRAGYTFLGWAETSDADAVLDALTFGEKGTITTYYAVWEQNIVPDPTSDVILDANGGVYTDGTAVLTLTGKVGAAVDSVKDYEEPTRDGYTFLGWAADSDADIALRTVEFGAEDTRTTYYAVWQYNKPEDDNGDKDPRGTLDFIGAMAYYRNRKNTVTFVADDCGGKVVSSTGAEKDKLTYTILDGARIKYVPSVVVAADYAFQHWYCPETEKTYTSNEIINMAVTADLTFQAVSLPTNVQPAIPSTDTTGTVIDAVESPRLNTTDAYAYLTIGSDGNVKPDEQITRGEVATLLFRLLTEESRETFWCKRNDFSDVPGTHALNTAISTIANAGIINGYPDGTFRPDNTITRAEFASILSKFVEVTGEEVSFSDVSGHWAESVIADIAAAGWINGYEDGTFRPDGLITRAEAVKILNAAANRTFNGNAVALNDVPADVWYYKEIEAAVSGKTIQWELLENPLNLFYFAVIK